MQSMRWRFENPLVKNGRVAEIGEPVLKRMNIGGPQALRPSREEMTYCERQNMSAHVRKQAKKYGYKVSTQWARGTLWVWRTA